MQIVPVDLRREYQQALAQWQFIPVIEAGHNLPRHALFAVGSRETNLTNEYGDYGLRNGQPGPLPGGAWAAGVWQLDAGSHSIPSDYLSHVPMQATVAASMLAALIQHYRAVFPALHPSVQVCAAFAAYNAGQGTVDWNINNGYPVDQGTAGDNYSADVYARMVWLQQNYPPPAPPVPAYVEDYDMMLLVPDPHDKTAMRPVWVVRPDLTGRVSLRSETAYAKLRATPGYSVVELPAQDLDRIPVLG